MWIIPYTKNGQRYYALPCDLDAADTRQGWSSMKGANNALIILNSAFSNLDRTYESPIKIDEYELSMETKTNQ